MQRPTNGPGARKTREEIAHALLIDIVSGTYPPGSRLPGFNRLRPTFGTTVSNTTFHAAVGILKELGFLNVRRRHSTSVADPLPYRNRYAIAFPHPLSQTHPTTLWVVLQRLALERQRVGGDSQYVVIAGYNAPGEQVAVRQALYEEVHWHRVAGVLFSEPMVYAANEPALSEPYIARVCMTSWSPTHGMPPMPRGGFDQPHRVSFCARGVAWLRAQDCRSVAVIKYTAPVLDTHPAACLSLWHPWQQELAARGLATRPEWLLALEGGAYEIALLLQGGRDRPDAIVIDDDILVPSVTAGLHAAGPPYPKVLARANFPALPQAAVPTQFLGHDIEAFFDQCAAALRDAEAQRACPMFSVPAIFEDEWRRRQGACSGRVDGRARF